MTNEQKIYIELLTAEFEGKQIETNWSGDWHDCTFKEMHVNTALKAINEDLYRIKPEPQYKPYDKPQIEWLGKVVKKKKHEVYSLITEIHINNDAVCMTDEFYSCDYLFKNYTWADGSIIGEVVK